MKPSKVIRAITSRIEFHGFGFVFTIHFIPTKWLRQHIITAIILRYRRKP